MKHDPMNTQCPYQWELEDEENVKKNEKIL